MIDEKDIDNIKCPYCGCVAFLRDEDPYMEYALMECPKCDNAFYVGYRSGAIIKAENWGMGTGASMIDERTGKREVFPDDEE